MHLPAAEISILTVSVIIAGAVLFLRRRLRRRNGCPHGFRRAGEGRHGKPTRFQPKPPWVRRELVRIKARMPEKGCRHIALVFNRIFEKRCMRVGKTFVADVLRESAREIESERRRWKRRKPRVVEPNDVWAMDITGLPDSNRKSHPVLGIIDHGSRRIVGLHAIETKASLALLRWLIEAIEHFGKPRALRTDNEAIFTSRLFRFGLWWMGIRHQRTEKHCPWQNGRIERFFGTLKRHTRQMVFDDREAIGKALGIFRIWYECVRPHQNLAGKTPWEAWNGEDPLNDGIPRSWRWVEEWDGVLSGFVPEKGGG